jgi:Ca-activated chloride channel family protein
LLFLCVGVLASPFGPTSAQQQSTGAVIEGTVVDYSRASIPGATVTLEQSGTILATTVTNAAGRFRFDRLQFGRYIVKAELVGFKNAVHEAIVSDKAPTVRLSLVLHVGALTETITVSAAPSLTTHQTVSRSVQAGGFRRNAALANTESYARIDANPFRLTTDEPLSTFAADVDTASFANVRRFLNSGQMPPVDAVRVEELVNYFRFAYPEPERGKPVSITAEFGECPWAPGRKLALVGLRAKPVDDRGARRRNLVLLLDVSGSMADSDKLPLVKSAMRMFVDTLRDDDRIAIVVYAGASGIALPSTPGSARERIHGAIESLEAGGSTNGAEGIVLAYQVAREQFIEGGINRVMLATDGDFNVGVTSQGDLLRLIQREKESGIFLSVFGVGTGNLKDSTMEMLADKGNGHYAYLDSLPEARRVLVKEGGATLETVAKDVKFQIEFNPALVRAWKLLGYENRLLEREDFNDDRKDGGELGAGHTVTVLYEIVPAGAPLPKELARDGRPSVDPLVYQSSRRPTAAASADLFTVKVRYKRPDARASELMKQSVEVDGPATHLPFAAAVMELGLLLREEQVPTRRWEDFVGRARSIPDSVPGADRAAFIELVDLVAALRLPPRR